MTTTATLVDRSPRPALPHHALDSQAPSTAASPERCREHWLFHMHDNSLTPVPWEAQSLAHHLARALEDPALDQHPRLSAGSGSRAVGRGWLITDTNHHRQHQNALELVLLALPGPEPVLGGLLEGAARPVRAAARLRQERQVARGPVAFVQGLEWCPPSAVALLTRTVMVVVNMGQTPLRLPAKAQVLVASAALEGGQDEMVVPPLTCVWLEPDSVSCHPAAPQPSL